MNTTIWQYLDFWKFQSLLKNGFHFRRSDKFIDPFEGHFAWGNNGIKKYMDARLVERNAQENPMPGYSYLLLKLQEYERKRKSTYVSCWHENRNESEAMWQLYTRIKEDQTAKALVIKSSTQTLEARLKPLVSPYRLEVNAVNYVEEYASEDYSDVSNSIFFKKRKCFEHEKEVRAVFSYKRFTSQTENDESLFYPCRLDEFIEEIRVSPFLGESFVSEVQELLDAFGMQIPVRASEILLQPEVKITEELTSYSTSEPQMDWSMAKKQIKVIDGRTIRITELFDNVKKEYIVKLNELPL